MSNPYGMDPECTRCPALVDTRDHIVHGYGDVGADFLFVAEQPEPTADRTGIPVSDTEEPRGLTRFLAASGFVREEVDEAGDPVLADAFVTHLTRCRHPDRAPTPEEIEACDAFLTAELRTINPEILVPLGERVLSVLGDEYTTSLSDPWDLDDLHATELRGRGFELIPLEAPSRMDEAQFETAIDRFDRTRDRDYRQTKGRRGR